MKQEKLLTSVAPKLQYNTLYKYKRCSTKSLIDQFVWSLCAIWTRFEQFLRRLHY